MNYPVIDFRVKGPSYFVFDVGFLRSSDYWQECLSKRIEASARFRGQCGSCQTKMNSWHSILNKSVFNTSPKGASNSFSEIRYAYESIHDRTDISKRTSNVERIRFAFQNGRGERFFVARDAGHERGIIYLRARQ